MSASKVVALKRHDVTSIEVARLAKVSQSAVSRTFTGASVSEATRRKVLAAAEQLGYRPNAIASTLSTRRSRIVAVVVSNLHNEFYPVVIELLSQQLQDHGYHVLLFCTDGANADELLQELLRYSVDGIVMGSTMLSSDLARRVAAAKVPVVMFNRTTKAGTISTVASDNQGGGRQVAHFLAGAGHRRIAYVAGAEDSSTNRDRERGFLEGLAEHGLELAGRAVGHYDFDGAAAAARTLFVRGASRRPDAVFVASDHMAFSVMDTLRIELGLRVPDDVSVVGFDDVPQAAWGAYQLTTVAQSAPAMVEATVATLMKQMADDKLVRDHTVVPVRLVVRRSARLPGSAGSTGAGRDAQGRP